ncbi:SIS domain-containing protein [Staphylococcus lentus]|uniref:SIS domain-containing protein n=1 Tax=Mammaliicoccus lentus TaxID=42858 RepID=UPI001883ACEC|nr:SIS domain-containing protein [Mammaliicoccus lentus]MBF0840389.1 SIS domain-containing protein [Mammaliicoccus lentus]
MNIRKYWKNIEDTLDVESAAIKDLKNKLNAETIIEIIKLLEKTREKVYVTGCGTSGAAAKKIVHSLNCVERPSNYINPTDAVHGGLGVIQKGDILIMISKGGNTQEIINLIPACKEKKAIIIGVTENVDSIIAKEANYLLNVKIDKEPDPFNMLATASTIAVISTFDAICIALMEYKQYTKKDFSTIHPGGAVGERLLND